MLRCLTGCHGISVDAWCDKLGIRFVAVRGHTYVFVSVCVFFPVSNPPLIELGWFGTDFKFLLELFGIFMAPFGVRRGLKMILSHRALSSFNISPYRAIWTHCRPIFKVFIHLILQLQKAVGIWDMSTTDSR